MIDELRLTIDDLYMMASFGFRLGLNDAILFYDLVNPSTMGTAHGVTKHD